MRARHPSRIEVTAAAAEVKIGCDVRYGEVQPLAAVLVPPRKSSSAKRPEELFVAEVQPRAVEGGGHYEERHRQQRLHADHPHSRPPFEPLCDQRDACRTLARGTRRGGLLGVPELPTMTAPQPFDLVAIARDSNSAVSESSVTSARARLSTNCRPS